MTIPQTHDRTELRRAVITEELLALTGDAISAAVLRQLLYWCPRVRDIDRYIIEERERNPETTINLTHGWIFKSARELSEEVMLASEDTVRRRLSELVEAGWLEERKNPFNAWDKTLQYRPNLVAIETALAERGYTLATVMGHDFPLVKAAFPATEREQSLPVAPLPASANPFPHAAESKRGVAVSKKQAAGAIPETTLEINTETSSSYQPPSPTRRQPERKRHDDDGRIPKLISVLELVNEVEGWGITGIPRFAEMLNARQRTEGHIVAAVRYCKKNARNPAGAFVYWLNTNALPASREQKAAAPSSYLTDYSHVAVGA